MKRPARRPGDLGGGVDLSVPVPCALADDYPHLWAFLADPQYDDGEQRETGTLLVTVGEGRVRVWLHDRAESCSAWVSGDDLTLALLACEKGLASGSLEWRADKVRGRR